MKTVEINLLDCSLRREAGRCWMARLPDNVPGGDSPDAPTCSGLELFEDGRKLGPAHAAHDNIRQDGNGRYSHWGLDIYFSSSDGSDPRKSGKQYVVRTVAGSGTREELRLALEAHRTDRHNYPHLKSSDFDAVIATAQSTLDRILSFVPEAEHGTELARMQRRLEGLKGAMFEDMNGFFRSTPKFDGAVEDHHSRFRNRRAVHLELGSYVAWPDSRVEQYISDMELGDMIRLDMNLAYKPDVAANVAALPFADQSIDVVSSNSLFEHVAYPHDIIRESFRVLRPGGLMLTAVPFHFVAHGCPNDYLRYTGQFFQEVCSRAGFDVVMSDTWGTSGPYYTTHQFLKGVLATEPARNDRIGSAGQVAHLTILMLLAALQPFDDYFDGGGSHHYHATRMLAVKPGKYVIPDLAPDRSKPIVERYDHLICPATGLPLRRKDDALVSLDGRHRYRIENGIPNLFTRRGFGCRFDDRASSRAQLAQWQRSHDRSTGIIGVLHRALNSDRAAK